MALGCDDTNFVSEVVAALDWIPQDPNRTTEARVVNMSWGYKLGDAGATAADLTAIDTAVNGLLSAGMTVVAAANNFSSDASVVSHAVVDL
jgi:hypothetical protein